MSKHFLHIYQKPALGSSFIKRFVAFQYRHKISANGGCDTASCSIACTREEAELIYNGFIGNRVAVYVDNPFEPIWEGFINRITLYAGSIQHTVSLDQMANRVIVQWSAGDGGLPDQTSEATVQDSIDTYGSKMRHVDLGEIYTTNTGLATATREALEDIRPYPQKSTYSAGNGGAGGYIIQLEFLGFYHTLTWDTFSVIAADSTAVPRALFGAAYTYNDNIFYNQSDTSQILATTSFTAPATRKAGESTWDLLKRLVEGYSSSTRYICGIGMINENSNNRSAYYKAVNTAIAYSIYAYSDGRIRNVSGGYISPWNIKPDNYVLIKNLNIGAGESLEDGTIVYIESIEYDAESGVVSWQSRDDITLPGVFNINRGVLATNEPFGAPKRWQVTDTYSISSLTTSGAIDAGTTIDAGGTITAGGQVNAGSSINAGTDVTAEDSVIGLRFQSLAISLNDDIVYTLPFPNTVGMHVLITGNAGSTTSALVWIDNGSAPRQEALYAGSLVLGTTAMTDGAGGGGTDGSFNLNTTATDIYFKNRTGAARSYIITFFG